MSSQGGGRPPPLDGSTGGGLERHTGARHPRTLDVEAFATSPGSAALDTEQGRLATFRTRWRTKGGEVVTFPEELGENFIKQLAKFGFYHFPDASHRDRCVCFSCKRALHTWEKGDSPLYEHCRWSPTCSFVQRIAADNLEAMLDAADPAPDHLDRSPPKQQPAAAPGGEGAPPGLPWPKDTVIDHLVICVYGNAMREETLATYLATMRANSAHVADKYLDERPMMMAVDAIDWHHSGVSAPQDTLEQITLQTVQGLRAMANDVWLDILYYTSPKYKYAVLDTVARMLSDTVARYRATYPQFSGKVSLFCHALGSVIVHDLLWHQKR